MESWELLGKAAARLPHSKSLLRNTMRDLVEDDSGEMEWAGKRPGCPRSPRFRLVRRLHPMAGGTRSALAPNSRSSRSDFFFTPGGASHHFRSEERRVGKE